MLETALSIGYISFFLWIIGKSSFYKYENIANRHFQWLFLLKLVAGFALFLVYTRFYPDRKYADIFRYYDDSKIVYDSLFHQPYDFFRMITGYHQSDKELMMYYNPMHNWFNSEMIFNDARTMIRLNVLFRFFSAGTYYPHSIFFCFMAFTGLTALFKVAASEIKERNILLLLGIFCMPSILFWTSGVIKEAFLVFSIGLMIYYITRIISKQGKIVFNILMLLFFVFCLLNIKSYVFFAILPCLISYIWVKQLPNRPLLKFLVVFSIYFFLLYSFSNTFTHHPVPELLQIKQQEFYKLAETENAKSVIRLPQITPSISSILIHAPAAFCITLLRPHLLESYNVMMLLSAIENALILFLLICNLVMLIRKRGLKFNAIFLFSLFFVVIIFCLIGLVTPVLGAVVRYKVAALPFLMLMLFFHDSWKNYFTYFKHKFPV